VPFVQKAQVVLTAAAGPPPAGATRVRRGAQVSPDPQAQPRRAQQVERPEHVKRIIAVATLALITLLNIFGVNLVALINNTGVIFEILGMVVFAFILAIFHNHQGVGVIFDTGGQSLTVSTFLVAMFMSLYVIYGFDTASTLAEETRDPRREAPKPAMVRSVWSQLGEHGAQFGA